MLVSYLLINIFKWLITVDTVVNETPRANYIPVCVYRSLPIFTRYWFGLTVLFTLVARFGLLSARWLILLWDPLFHE
jgi:hypothetical protein